MSSDARTPGRREFLALTAGGLAALAWPDWARRGPVALDRIGVQLYTVRQAMREDMARTLARVAEIGFQEVEFAGYFDRSASQVRDLLAQNGLRAPAGHMGFDRLGEDWEKTLDFAREIGHEYVVIAWTPAESRRTLDDWKRIAERFNRAGDAARRNGLQFAYHNHDFEFVPLQGRIPFDLLLAESDPSLVRIEMDLYWTVKGGGDPLAYFRQYPGRFPMVHVKDLKRGDPPAMVDVGRGDIDFRTILARHREAGIRHYFVEHDEPADPFASITASYRYLHELAL